MESDDLTLMKSLYLLAAMEAKYRISERESQVMRAMFRGLSVVEIAAEMDITVATVVFHVRHLLKKTKTKTRVHFCAKMFGYGAADETGKRPV